MPKRGDIHPVTGLVYWDTWRGKQRWRTPEVIASWRANTMRAVVRWQKADPERHRSARRRFNSIHGKRRNAEARGFRLAWKAEKRATDPVFKMRENLSHRLAFAVRRIGRGQKPPTLAVLGCTMEEFIAHIESMFWPGMTWQNHSFYGWHIDHRVPLSSATTVEDVAKLCHYTNLQPLWWNDNFAKGSKLLTA